MRPKGWRLDPAWVEYYSKIEQERLEREFERISMAHKLNILKQQERYQSDILRDSLSQPDEIKKFWSGDWGKG